MDDCSAAGDLMACFLLAVRYKYIQNLEIEYQGSPARQFQSM